MKTPISLIIDDSTPLVQVYHAHVTPPVTKDGRQILKDIPNDFLTAFCDVVERFGIRGKFSVVPCPACRGNIADGIEGFSKEELQWWLETIRTRLSPYFAFCPEILTHYKAADLRNGGYLNETEREWGAHATAEEMTDYIARALEICRDAGIDCTGVTSPWDFGITNEKNYAQGIAMAFDRVFGRKQSWYFLHNVLRKTGTRAWVEYDEDGRKVVSVPYTVGDAFWQTIDRDDSSEEYARSVADGVLTEDGKRGQLIDVLKNESYPILCTHWQSMFSNGNRTGLRALEIAAERIERYFGDTLEWVDFNRQMDFAIRDGISRPEL